MKDTQRSENVCTKQRRIAEIARQHPQERLTALHHYLDMEWLTEAFYHLRRDSAPGVDGQTVDDYEEQLEEKLASLLHRAKSGSYVAPPVKRVHIPKDGTGETRPIGIPTCENKVLERAVLMLLEPIYEEVFYDFSYGFRPGRSTHQGLENTTGANLGRAIGLFGAKPLRSGCDVPCGPSGTGANRTDIGACGISSRYYCVNWKGTTPITASPATGNAWNRYAPRRRSYGANG